MSALTERARALARQPSYGTWAERVARDDEPFPQVKTLAAIVAALPPSLPSQMACRPILRLASLALGPALAGDG